jgi:hypothetical protein
VLDVGRLRRLVDRKCHDIGAGWKVALLEFDVAVEELCREGGREAGRPRDADQSERLEW